MIKEPTLEQIWEARRRIYAKCDNDPTKLVEYYMARQKEHPERFASLPVAPKTNEKKNKK